MAAKTALITGGQGFCGRALAAELITHGYQVHSLDQPTAPPDPGVPLHGGDIRDPVFMSQVLAEVRPAIIFHLAALTRPEAGWDALHDVNVRGTQQLLEAVRQTCPEAVVLVTGSSAAYGRVGPEELPIRESQPFRPMTVYAVSKITQEMLAHAYYARYGLKIIRSRAFNLTGPGEGPGFVTSAFARQLAKIEAGRQAPVLHVGNLDTVRDLVDVRDAVRAYRLLAEQAEPGAVYNVCSGQGTPIRTLLDILLGLALVPGVRVELDPDRLQPADVPIQVGDGTFLRTLTGWTPEFTLEQTLHDVLAHWRKRIAEER